MLLVLQPAFMGIIHIYGRGNRSRGDVVECFLRFFWGAENWGGGDLGWERESYFADPGWYFCQMHVVKTLFLSGSG